MARPKKKVAGGTDLLDCEPRRFDEDDEFEVSDEPSFKERYTVSVVFTVKSEDLDIAEDSIGDLISEAIEKMADNYKPDLEIVDYYLDTEPAELP